MQLSVLNCQLLPDYAEYLRWPSVVGVAYGLVVVVQESILRALHECRLLCAFARSRDWACEWRTTEYMPYIPWAIPRVTRYICITPKGPCWPSGCIAYFVCLSDDNS
jgi:hypothetical protein